jgi:flagellar basal body rod protein FlgG
MGFFTNLFSGKVYNKTSSTITTPDGDLYIKSGNNWIGENGELIQRQGTDLVNIETGVRSSFGDPFNKEEK